MRLLERMADLILIGLGVPEPGLDRQPAFALQMDPLTGQRVQVATAPPQLVAMDDEIGVNGDVAHA
jgi:hypothetical protein